MLVFAAALSLAACGGSVDPTSAETCAELEDLAVPIMQMALDSVADVPLDEIVDNDSVEISAVVEPDRWQEIDDLANEWEARSAELRCPFNFFAAVSERRDDLNVRTRSAEYFLELFLGDG